MADDLPSGHYRTKAGRVLSRADMRRRHRRQVVLLIASLLPLCAVVVVGYMFGGWMSAMGALILTGFVTSEVARWLARRHRVELGLPND